MTRWLVTCGRVGSITEVATSEFDFTLVDPGGCETASITAPSSTENLPGATLRIFAGATEVWTGEVEEPGVRGQEQSGAVVIAGVGAGVALKRYPYSMVYIDRDLSAWLGLNRAREVALNGTVQPYLQAGVHYAAGSPPGLKLDLSGPLSGSAGGACEALYDAGPGNTIARLLWDSVDNVSTGTAPDWAAGVYRSPDGDGTFTLETNFVNSLVALDDTFGSAERCVMIQLAYSSTTATDANRFRSIRGLRVCGDHGLTLDTDTSGNQGIRASVIASDAAGRSGAGFTTDIDASTDVVIPHLVHKQPVTPEEWISEAAKYAGAWHWGVWPSPVVNTGTPVFRFKEPRSGNYYAIDYGEIVSPDLTERLSQQHNIARVNYTLPDGTQGYTTVEIDNPRLPVNVDQVLEVDAGMVGVESAATVIGTYRLQLDQASARVAGSGVLPYVRDAAGAKVPAWTIRPGLDTLIITGLPTTGSLIAGPPARIDTFRVSRLTVSVRGGREEVRAEFDTGADLTETLTARLAVASTLAGV